MNTIVKSLSNMDLKFGCTVWFLFGDEIMKGIFVDKFYRGGNDLVDVKRKAIDFNGRVITRTYVWEPRLLFESREALCEHYRKIFE